MHNVRPVREIVNDEAHAVHTLVSSAFLLRHQSELIFYKFVQCALIPL